MQLAPPETVQRLAESHIKAILATRDVRRARLERAAYPSDYETFLSEILGMTITPNQREILQAVQKYRRVAIKSCHASGKTRVVAGLTAAFLHIYRNSRVITTAPGAVQLQASLWSDIRFLAQNAKKPLLSMPLITKWEIAPAWGAIGIKPAENRPASLHGLHADHVLLIVDEAAEVPLVIFDSLQSLMTSDNAHIVLIGNPTVCGTPFHRAFTTEAHLWHNISIPASATPNIIAGRTVVPGLITPMWVKETIDINGIDSPYVRSRVYAEFPEDAADAFILLKWIEEARRYFHSSSRAGGLISRESAISSAQDGIPLLPIEQRIEPHLMDDGVVEVSLDPARFGDDVSVATAREGWRILDQLGWRGADLMDSVARLESFAIDVCPRRPDKFKIDTIGLGSGIADRLREKGWAVDDLDVRKKSKQPELFADLRAEFWWSLHERFREGRIAGDFSPKTIAQLTGIGYEYDSTHSRPRVEPKDKTKKRLGESPDYAESLMLCFAKPLEPTRRESRSVAAVGIPAQEHDWTSVRMPNDPFSPFS